MKTTATTAATGLSQLHQPAVGVMSPLMVEQGESMKQLEGMRAGAAFNDPLSNEHPVW